ncbi:hypothetical protein Dfri01_46670 [Dyadobacter frigoris]|uniref:DUF1579 family protein n=1 Tax=Dyadobacter frigoris TaxID=2576211 RepID=UPI0024A41871|nr:DUF1579 family protein [Dyadobacter frigoris]GLU55206.1 hypothetical protein Dfri01_46670 [Dyadobacter frigoris]
MTKRKTLQSPERIYSKFGTMVIFTLLLPITLSFAQTPSSANKQGVIKNDNDSMKQMLDYSGPGENHAILNQLAGKWNFMDPKRPYIKGTLSRKPIYDGRFYTVEITGGKLPLPVGNGKMKDGNYQNLQIEGYDNPKAKFVTTSINNHIGSDIEMQFGSFDKEKNTFTYEWETELIPGLKKTNRRVLRIIDMQHYIEEYFELQDGHQVKIRELDYTRSSE